MVNTAWPNMVADQTMSGSSAQNSQTEILNSPLGDDSVNGSAEKLRNKTAIITGGDSGIGRAVALRFADEGADICILYLDEHEDARETMDRILDKGRRCLIIPGDIGDPGHCRKAVERAISDLDGLDCLVNNAGEQHLCDTIEMITPEQLERTFRTNIFGMFFMTQAAASYFKPGSTIINTASISAYRGSPHLIDYASSKGAVVAFTRSLALNLVTRNIRVNAVAPGPIWTPLVETTNTQEELVHFGKDTPMARAGRPDEVAPIYVYLASDDSSYVTGQTFHINGGEIVNG